MWGMLASFCLQLPCPGDLLTPPALMSQPELRGQEARVQAGGQLFPSNPPHTVPHSGPSHEIAALGSVLVYFTLIPVAPVRPSSQLGGSLQSPA